MKKTDGRVSTATIDNGDLVMDSTYFPVIITAWRGVTTPELVDCYAEFRNPLTEHADRIGKKVVVITDTSQWTLPGAATRKYIADRAVETDRQYASMFHYIIVVPNTLLRGIVTAVAWIIDQKGPPIHQVPSIAAAFALARRLYAKEGLDCPELPTSYTVPFP